MTIFDYIKDIMVYKKGNLELELYSQFLVNRWLSFSSPAASVAINQTVNSLGNIDKNVHYKLLISAFPKFGRMPRIDYIKKVKPEKEEKDNKVALLSSNLELSQREIKQLLELKELTT